MSEPTKKQQPTLDWNPTPGHLLCKPLKREEVAELYKKQSARVSLSMPDNMGRVTDSVAVGQVIKMGPPAIEKALHIDEVYGETKTPDAKQNALTMFEFGIQPGDYVAYMPFTDVIIEIDGAKYHLVEYEKIRAVRKGNA